MTTRTTTASLGVIVMVVNVSVVFDVAAAHMFVIIAVVVAHATAAIVILVERKEVNQAN